MQTPIRSTPKKLTIDLPLLCHNECVLIWQWWCLLLLESIGPLWQAVKANEITRWPEWLCWPTAVSLVARKLTFVLFWFCYFWLRTFLTMTLCCSSNVVLICLQLMTMLRCFMWHAGKFAVLFHSSRISHLMWFILWFRSKTRHRIASELQQ